METLIRKKAEINSKNIQSRILSSVLAVVLVFTSALSNVSLAFGESGPMTVSWGIGSEGTVNETDITGNTVLNFVPSVTGNATTIPLSFVTSINSDASYKKIEVKLPYEMDFVKNADNKYSSFYNATYINAPSDKSSGPTLVVDMADESGLNNFDVLVAVYGTRVYSKQLLSVSTKMYEYYTDGQGGITSESVIASDDSKSIEIYNFQKSKPYITKVSIDSLTPNVGRKMPIKFEFSSAMNGQTDYSSSTWAMRYRNFTLNVEDIWKLVKIQTPEDTALRFLTEEEIQEGLIEILPSGTYGSSNYTFDGTKLTMTNNTGNFAYNSGIYCEMKFNLPPDTKIYFGSATPMNEGTNVNGVIYENGLIDIPEAKINLYNAGNTSSTTTTLVASSSELGKALVDFGLHFKGNLTISDSEIQRMPYINFINGDLNIRNIEVFYDVPEGITITQVRPNAGASPYINPLSVWTTKIDENTGELVKDQNISGNLNNVSNGNDWKNLTESVAGPSKLIFEFGGIDAYKASFQPVGNAPITYFVGVAGLCTGENPTGKYPFSLNALGMKADYTLNGDTYTKGEVEDFKTSNNNITVNKSNTTNLYLVGNLEYITDLNNTTISSNTLIVGKEFYLRQNNSPNSSWYSWNKQAYRNPVVYISVPEVFTSVRDNKQFTIDDIDIRLGDYFTNVKPYDLSNVEVETLQNSPGYNNGTVVKVTLKNFEQDYIKTNGGKDGSVFRSQNLNIGLKLKVPETLNPDQMGALTLNARTFMWTTTDTVLRNTSTWSTDFMTVDKANDAIISDPQLTSGEVSPYLEFHTRYNTVVKLISKLDASMITSMGILDNNGNITNYVSYNPSDPNVIPGVYAGTTSKFKTTLYNTSNAEVTDAFGYFIVPKGEGWGANLFGSLEIESTDGTDAEVYYRKDEVSQSNFTEWLEDSNATDNTGWILYNDGDSIEGITAFKFTAKTLPAAIGNYTVYMNYSIPTLTEGVVDYGDSAIGYTSFNLGNVGGSAVVVSNGKTAGLQIVKSEKPKVKPLITEDTTNIEYWTGDVNNINQNLLLANVTDDLTSGLIIDNKASMISYFPDSGTPSIYTFEQWVNQNKSINGKVKGSYILKYVSTTDADGQVNDDITRTINVGVHSPKQIEQSLTLVQSTDKIKDLSGTSDIVYTSELLIPIEYTDIYNMVYNISLPQVKGTDDNYIVSLSSIELLDGSNPFTSAYTLTSTEKNEGKIVFGFSESDPTSSSMEQYAGKTITIKVNAKRNFSGNSSLYVNKPLTATATSYVNSSTPEGNILSKSVEMSLEYGVKPVLIGPDSKILPLSNGVPSTSAEWISVLGLTTEKNVSLDPNPTISVDASRIPNSPVTNAWYIITAKAIDASGNESDIKSISIAFDDGNTYKVEPPSNFEIPVANSQSFTSESLLEEMKLKGLKVLNGSVDVTNDSSIVLDADSFNSLNQTRIGEYKVTIGATYGALKNAQQYVTVKVVDKVKPVVTVENTVLHYQVSQTTPVSLNKVLADANITVSDNYDTEIMGNMLSYEVAGGVEGKSLGKYTLIVYATDSSNNIASTVTINVNIINDNSPVISGINEGQRYVIEAASDILSDSDLINRIGLTVVDDSGEKITPVLSPAINYTKASPEIKVVAKATNSSGNSSEVNFKLVIVDTIAPNLHVNNTSINYNYLGRDSIQNYTQNDWVNLFGITSTDAVDGDITSLVQVSSTVPASNKIVLNKAYSVKLTSTDNAGNKSESIVTVTFTDPAGFDPRIDTNNNTPYVWDIDKTFPTNTELLEYYATTPVYGGYVGEIGDIVTNLDVYYNNKSSLGDKQVTLTYTIDGKTATAIVVLRIADLTPPNFDINNSKLTSGSYVVNVNNPKSLIEIVNDVTNNVSDNYDSASKISVYSVSSNYNGSVVGNYTVDIVASDNSGNISETKTLSVKVVDTTAPVFIVSGNPVVRSNYSIEVGTAYTLEEIMNKIGITVTDNYDNYPTYTADISTIDFRKVSNNEITVTAQDSSLNTSTMVIELNIIKTKGPLISDNGSEIELLYSSTKELTVEEWLDWLNATVTDVIEDEPIVSIDSSTIPESGIPEIDVPYKVIINAEDIYGNKSSKEYTVTFKTSQELPDIEIIKGEDGKNITDLRIPVVTETNSNSMSLDEFISTLNPQIGQSNYNEGTFEIKSNFELAVDQTKCGTYDVLLQLYTLDNKPLESKYTLKVEVYDDIAPVWGNSDSELIIEAGREVSSSALELLNLFNGTVTDNYDETSKLIINYKDAGEVNYAVPGEYNVTLVSEDTSGNKSEEKVFKVIVRDTVSPTISVENPIVVTEYTSSVFGNEDYWKNLFGVDVFDAVDNEVKVTYDSSEVPETPVPNKAYKVTIIAKDFSDNESTQEVYVTYHLNNEDAFIEIGRTELTYEVFSDTSVLENIISEVNPRVTSYPKADFKVDYSNVNLDITGLYYAKITLIDEEGNEVLFDNSELSEVYVAIRVIDTVAPIINADNVEYEAYKGLVISEKEIIERAKASVMDNYDTEGLVIRVKDFTENTIDTSVLGTTRVTLITEDSSGNIGTLEIELNLVKTIPPIINTKLDLDGKVSYTTSTQSKVTVRELLDSILSDVPFTDNFYELNVDDIKIEGIKLNSDGTLDTNSVYCNELTLSITDPNGNVSEFVTVVLNIVDLENPLLKTKNSKVYTIVGNKLTKEEILNKSGAVATDNMDKNIVIELSGLEEVNFNKVGSYVVSLVTKDLSNNESEIVTVIIVVEAKKEENNGGGRSGGTIVNSNTTKPTEKEKTETPEITENPKQESKIHTAYINGYPDGTFKADSFITRAEMSIILYNLIKDKDTNSYNSNFSDVNKGSWYYEAVSYLANKGIVLGYPDGTFKPNQNLTREEYSVVLAKLFNLELKNTNKFVDVLDTDWSNKFIGAIQDKGWVVGYTDNSFKPHSLMTRAELITVTNKAFGRNIDNNSFVNVKLGNKFSDLVKSHWAYNEIIEASISHNYNLNNEKEVWVNNN